MFRQHDNRFCAVLHASNKAFALMYTNKYVYLKNCHQFPTSNSRMIFVIRPWQVEGQQSDDGMY